ncbi:efflux transporter outer membrane subunit [Granulicella arctica]|uniref:NodT family efflux transporter outer membrane factor (OMF) lipoprotein n=1 Tax=Granulicella arctica TaxID=940613 RepID=A0A7Y9PFK5_9BACT|nr:efflux transporter outer membrane subunit [Granulicella arctica]NYF78976.1 NodT family efflux transporter outer membrane factor (OMF) lipoprotein [Granulicella arctica]
MINLPRKAACYTALAALPTLAALLLGGCRIGPKYTVPPATAQAPPASYKESPTQFTDTDTNSNAWKVAQPGDAMLRGKWWEIYNEPELNTLEEQLNINNQNIKQFFENFMAARTLITQARAQLYPTASVGPTYSRSRSSANTSNTGTTGTSGGKETSLTELPLDVSWEPDLWGKVRNTIREQQYSAQLSAADLENERLTEQASLAEYFFELRGQDALVQIYDETIAADKKSLDYTQAQYDTGVGDRISVVEAQNTLQNAQAAAINLGVARAQYEHAIAMLIGTPASGFSIPVRPLLKTAPAIPIGVPSQLLERRPDIAASERTMASANAQIGVATAAFYPTLTLSASGGFESSTFKHLLDWPSRFWSIGPSVSETVFDAGLRRATVNQYISTYNADVAGYRQTILTAFQQVEDYLAAVRILQQQIQQQELAMKSAQEFVDLEMSRYQTGIDPYVDVVTAQTTLLTDRQTLATLHVQQMTASVQLIAALGGGWDASQLPTPAQVSKKLTKAETQITK